MYAAARARRLCRILKPPFHLGSAGFVPPNDRRVAECARIRAQACRDRSSSFSSAAQSLGFAGPVHGNRLPAASYSIISSLQYSSEASAGKEEPTETVKELYDKILESVNTKRTMAPNAWTWSMIENCKNREDIKLLFDVLQNLRRFRLSNLRIHENFNCNLCREVTKACVRARALDFGKKALWEHNVYGLTPTIGSAKHLLQYAKEHRDAALMQEVMKLLKKNNLQLQPSTADIVSSICNDTDNWGLLAKYSKRFVKGGVKLHKAAFDIWMEFAAKVGDVESLWKIEKLRSESMKQHTMGSGFSCAKGLLLEGKPEEAATVIHVLNQSLPDAKRSGIMVELQKLISEWPFEVIKRKKEDERKALAAALKSDIPAMVSSLLNTGLEVKVNMEELTTEGALC
ncbi:hypothetical protein EUGRSUZ_H03774 [Eucalyptus grandis]|uniref:Uncharacterized protein n=2 Tax=Eucalyptus grandis TaxID=71139 RepID=A0ACC3JV50_EUCGR|nr:hypothetical protein EUGRSUZ_H03774 [Eucalyptus grandis]